MTETALYSALVCTPNEHINNNVREMMRKAYIYPGRHTYAYILCGYAADPFFVVD